MHTSGAGRPEFRRVCELHATLFAVQPFSALVGAGSGFAPRCSRSAPTRTGSTQRQPGGTGLPDGPSDGSGRLSPAFNDRVATPLGWPHDGRFATKYLQIQGKAPALLLEEIPSV